MATLKYKVFVSTWNVGGIQPADDLSLDDWLETSKNSYDIYVLGFQEIIPLSARNVLGPERRNTSVKWNSLIGSTLNSHGRVFSCFTSKQMVGILISVWVRGDLLDYISYPSVSCVGCGIIGRLKNKGSVSVRFYLHETSFCFVCCHLASGGKDGDELQRNSNVVDVLSRTSFSTGETPSTGLPTKILDHDRVVLFGDLNYRISMPGAKTRELVERKQWNVLLDRDQLRFELSRGGEFEGWNEGVITFSPTYKYQVNSEEYYWDSSSNKARKNRPPAWCDRILWIGEGLKQNGYDRFESSLSDHRPVRAAFTAEANVLQFLKPLSGFFLSHELDEIIMDHTIDELLS